MRIYVMTDMEGASGVTQELQTFSDAKRRNEGRLALTKDVNACVAGANDVGAEHVLVCDAHGADAGYNFVYEELVDGARYILGAPWNYYCEGLDESFDSMFYVAGHAMAGTFGGILDHTMSSRAQVNVHINGVRLGEVGITAALAGHHGVPLNLITGDEAVSEEVTELLGDGVITAAVKRGYRRQSAACLPPNEARQLIREKSAEAVEAARRGDVLPVTFEKPVRLQVEYLRTEQAEGWRKRLGDGIEMSEARTVIIERGDPWDAIQVYCGYA